MLYRLSKASSRLALSLCAVTGVTACAEPESPATERDPFETMAPEPAPARRLAHIQLVLRSEAAAPAQKTAKSVDAAPSKEASVAAPSSPAALPAELKVRGDFAAFRGVEERLVWAFAGVSKPAWAGLQVGDCMGIRASSHRETELPSAESQGRLAREIELLDLGPFEVQLGNDTFEVPLHLAPGILPYASGVQYRGEQILLHPQYAKGKEPAALSLGWQGLASAQLPGTRFVAAVPPALNLELSSSAELLDESNADEQEATWYDLRWSPLAEPSREAAQDGDTPNSLLFLHARLAQEDEDTAENAVSQVVCHLPDRGEWQLDLEELMDLGLALPAGTGPGGIPMELELRRVSDFDRVAPGFERLHLRVERSERVRFQADI